MHRAPSFPGFGEGAIDHVPSGGTKFRSRRALVCRSAAAAGRCHGAGASGAAGVFCVRAHHVAHGAAGDNFDLNSSHVLPALIRKAHEAKVAGAPTITLWGTGTPRREFLHADDCADALVFLLKNYSDASHVNVGSGEDLPILELAQLVSEVVGFEGEITLDRSKPDGTPRKLMDSGKLQAMGWSPRIPLRDGLAATYEWYLSSASQIKPK